MRKDQFGLILGLLGLLLVHAPAEGQSFGPATWIRQAWAGSRPSWWTFIPMDIAVGPGEEVFVTGLVDGREGVWFEASASDIQMLDMPNQGFLVGYDGRNGNLTFLRPGSVLPDADPDCGHLYTIGHSVAVFDGRVFHAEGAGLLNGRERSGSKMVTVRDLGGAVQSRFGPRVFRQCWPSVFMQGSGFDAQGNFYVVGTFDDTLYFSPDVVLAPSSSHILQTWDVFVASYAPDGTVRWARQIEGGTGHLWVSNGRFGRAPFDVDAAGNMVLGAVARGVPPRAFSAAEDGVVLAYYGNSDGALQQVRTLKDLGISYTPSNGYAPVPRQMRRNKNGDMYVLWSMVPSRSGVTSLTVSDTTFRHRGEIYMWILTKFDAQGTPLWARNLESQYILYESGMEIAENGHVYVFGGFWGRYVEFEGVRLTQEGAEGDDGFVAHYDENGNLVRALHLAATGDSRNFIEALGFGPSGDVYIAGKYYADEFFADQTILGSDTLHTPGKNNMFIAKYSATSLSSEPSLEIPSGVIEATNYPNPFQGSTTITYSVPLPGKVRLTVYDVLGRELAVLVDEWQGAGSRTVRLDASTWPKGVYLYRLETGNQVATGQLVHR